MVGDEHREIESHASGGDNGLSSCLSNDASTSTCARGSTAIAVDWDLSLLSGDDLGDGEEGVHCSQVN